MESVGLSLEYGAEEPQTRNWLMRVFGLPFLDPEEVQECFAIDFATDKPINRRIEEFCNYLSGNFLSRGGIFPPIVWAKMSANPARMNDSCMELHANFRVRVDHGPLGVENFVKNLVEFQTRGYVLMNETYSLMRENKEGHEGSYLLLKKRFLEDRIREYEARRISRYEYVRKISNLFNRF